MEMIDRYVRDQRKEELYTAEFKDWGFRHAPNKERRPISGFVFKIRVLGYGVSRVFDSYRARCTANGNKLLRIRIGFRVNFEASSRI